MIDRRSILSAIISTALLPPSLAMITPVAAQGTLREGLGLVARNHILRSMTYLSRS